MSALLCLCACPDAAHATRIAHALVEERLAACVNIVPGMHSVYRWQERVEQADEMLLLIKTSQLRAEALRTRLPQLHPYQVPELLMFAVDGGLSAYLEWLAAQTTPGAA